MRRMGFLGIKIVQYGRNLRTVRRKCMIIIFPLRNGDAIKSKLIPVL